MRVLIADKLSKRMEDALRDLGVDMDVRPDLTAGQLPEAIGDAHALVVRSTKVSAETINSGRKLSLIVRAGAGVNTIDTTAASSRGIYVTNCPGMNSAAVAELAIGLLVACDRRIVDASADLRAGNWRKKEYGKSRGLRGRTLGILGVGMIGQAVASAARGLGMRVAAWSRSLDPTRAEELQLDYCDSPLDLARCSDAVSIHLAASPETRGFVGPEFLQAMREGAIFINTSRGEVVDQDALAQAIEQRGLRVGLDVFADEPAGGESPFAQIELARRITATPHIGASTEQASEAVADDVVRIIKAFHETGKPPKPINMCLHSPATHSLVIRHYNRVGVLAGILDLLREENINVEEMENTIFDGAQAACCTLQLDAAPSQAALAALEQNELILQITSGSR
jgi:D-3-phosphoglycerate dehydrogenase